MRIVGCGLAGLVLVVVACAGEQKEPGVPPPPPAEPMGEEAADPDWETGDGARPDYSEPEPEEPKEAELKEPEFKPGMSVNDAISAVPSHYDYVGLDQEVLAKPLMDIETYKDCKITPNDHFQVKLAIWMGKVVGADVKAATPDKTQCIDRVVRGLEYKEQVESINTVEYSF